MTLDLSPGALLVGAGLLPEAWSRLLAAPAELLADTLTDARLLWRPATVDALTGRVAEAGDDDARADAVDGFVRDILREREADADPLALAVERWIEGCPTWSLDALSHRLGLGARQTARLTLRLYGAGLKTLAMKY